VRTCVFEAHVPNERFIVGRDEDTTVTVRGAAPSVVVQLPPTTTAERTVVVDDPRSVERILKIQTADYGADALRVVCVLDVRGAVREQFVFAGGYWQRRTEEKKDAQ